MSRVSNGGSYEWQIINNGTTYSVDNLSGGKLIERLYEKLSIGNVMSRQLELTLYDVTIDPTKSITLKINALTSSGTSTIYDRGVYFIDTIEKSPYSDFTQITAYDAMLKANAAYLKTGSSWIPTTDKAIVQDIATNFLGVAIESNTLTLLNTTKTIDQAPSIGDNGTTARDMLSVIAIMRGGNWIINDANELELVPLTGRLNPHATVVVGDDVVRFDVSPSETVTRVELWSNSTTSYRSPSGLTEAQWDALGGIVLSANMPIMASQTLADSLYTSYNGFVYVPYTADSVYVDAEIQLGTALTIKNDTVVMSDRTVNIDTLSASDLTAKSLNTKSWYPFISNVERENIWEIGVAQSTAEAAQNAAEAAQNAADGANAMEQLIYISKASGTTSVAKNTTWVTNTTGNQNVWTTKRPVYSSNYPVLFVATQRQAVDGTVTCTTPVIDETTTVIDGGHISTHTIDASALIAKTLTVGNFDDSVQTSLSNGDSAYGTANANADRLDELDGYIQTSGGVLTLGKVGNNFKTQLDNTELAFLQGDDKIAYLSNSKLYITEAEIKTNLQVGNYQWIAWSEEGTNKGRMSLKWVASQS